MKWNKPRISGRTGTEWNT